MCLKTMKPLIIELFFKQRIKAKNQMCPSDALGLYFLTGQRAFVELMCLFPIWASILFLLLYLL